MATVLVTDHSFTPLDVERAALEPLGVELAARQCRTPEQIAAEVGAADVVITQFAPVTAAVLAAMPNARAVVRYGVGVDNVDLDAARELGIPVCNVPDYCVEEVADHTLALILALTRQVVPHHLRLAAGGWGLAVPVSTMSALRERSVGVAGFGRIGRAVVRRLTAFGGRVRVFDPVVTTADITNAGAEPVASLPDLLDGCDVLTLHCPSTAKTRRMIDAAALGRLPPGAVVVNVGRGDLIDTPAIVAALESGRLAGAGLDVFDPEPPPAEHPLRRLPNVVLAPHVASVSPAAVRRLRTSVAAAAAAALRGELPPNVVNGVTRPRCPRH
jgi:D-3-phosphoglycerate dehydrogenase